MLRFTASRTALVSRLSRAGRMNLTRNLHVQSPLLAAQVFRMPAMSPTMEEGGIVSWKVENGQEFAAGDVLLEVETDKATIDVEAQDDGTMWEILEKDGATGIAVGKPIALLAEPGDDLASLEKPSLEESAPKKEEKKPEAPQKEAKIEPQPEQKPQKQLEEKTTPASGEVFTKANPKQKLTPAVELLLHIKGISTEDALANIPASGPGGRLLKGDVLAYVGDIDKKAIEKVTTYIKSKEHLDLSNIKVAPPKETKASPEAKAEKPVAPKPSNVLSVEFVSELGENVSEYKFQHAFEKALHTAVTQTYGFRFPEFSRGPSASQVDVDDIFDDLLVAPASKSRFDVSNVQYKFIRKSVEPASSISAHDEFDELLGLGSSPAPIARDTEGPVSAAVKFNIKFDEKLVDSKEFVEDFQERLLSQIPTKQLIITQV